MKLECEVCKSVKQDVTLTFEGIWTCPGCIHSPKGDTEPVDIEGAMQTRLEKFISKITKVDRKKIKESIATVTELAESVASTKQTVETAGSDVEQAKYRIDRLMKQVELHLARISEFNVPRTVEFKRDDATKAIQGHTHKQVPKLADLVSGRVDCYLYGMAGTGKNTAVEQVANGFGLAYHCLQLSQLSLRSELMGFVSPVDRVPVQTPFSLAYANGGVFLADELDNWNASIVTAANSAIANSAYAFPWGVVPRHPDFVWVGAGNTIGMGGTAQYQERRALSGATRDRMPFIRWDVDEDLERALATNKEWCAFVQTCRQLCKDNGERILVTPRATLQGCKLLKMDWKRIDVVESVLLRGADAPSYLLAAIKHYVDGGVP